MKMKNKFDQEYELVGYISGKKGKDADALMWIFKTSNGLEFIVRPDMQL